MVSNAERPRQHYNVTLVVLTLAGIAFAFQQTMVVPALPAFQRDLDTTTTWVTWLLTAFMLTASVATPLFGKLGDQYGKERMLVVSLTIFFVGSLAAIFAWDLPSLIACRMIQGCGAAVFPLSFAIIKDEFPPERVAIGIAAVSSVFGVGGGLGLSLSGVIVDQLSWRYLFVFGAVPIGIAAVLVHKFVPESPIKTPARLDVKGALLLSAALVCLLLGLTEGESWGWTSAPIVGLFGGAALFTAAWAHVENRVPEPMVDLKMLASRTVLLANSATLIATAAVFGGWVLIPVFVQSSSDAAGYGFDASSTQAGLYLLPGAVAGLAAGPLGARIGHRYGSKWSLAIGLLICGISFVMLAMWHAEPWHVIAGAFVLGFGFPMMFAAVANIVVDAVRPTETGVASGMNTVMRTIGGVIGAQAGAAVLTAQTIAGSDLPAESAFTTVYWVAAAGAIAATLLALLVTPRRTRSPVAVAGAAK